ncbi:hypothetical protein [Hydrogenimonas cancrithermarum]|uniref:hypothetical protein n=1 Tax=Hydrogenimonas cancrithermarum TaxID=2993563 RepID=UPI0025741977|nr:hypothetical protein [Hydrogenimonas cancrithermarum]
MSCDIEVPLGGTKFVQVDLGEKCRHIVRSGAVGMSFWCRPNRRPSESMKSNVSWILPPPVSAFFR